MRKKGRFSLAVMTIAFLLVPLVSTPFVLAEEVTFVQDAAVDVIAQADPSITLEEAITIVKTNFEVPEEYINFNTGFSTYFDRQVWSLNWSGPEGDGGYFSAEVNALTGDIINMNCWEGSKLKDQAEAMLALTKEEAQNISDELLARLLGERVADLRLIPNEREIVPLSYYGWEGYSFQYQRLINDVPFLNNGVSVQVAKNDGIVTSYYLNWSEVQAPEPKGIMGSNQAEKAFAEAPFFKLRYFLPYGIRPLADGQNQKQEAKLVYELTGQNQGAIDAFTGEPLKSDNRVTYDMDAGVARSESAKEMSGGMGVFDSAQIELTPQERQELELSGQLIKQDAAIEAVKKWVEIPASLTLRSVSLSRDYMNSDVRCWQFEWNQTGSERKEGEPSYFVATVNASNGELTSFHSGYSVANKTETALDQETVQKLAEDFLKKIQPEKFKQVTLVDEENNYKLMVTPDPWSVKYFSYQRVVNGIDFPENSLSVGVDPVSGKITDYSYSWVNYDLPGVEGVMSKEAGVKAFLQARPLTLAYIQTYTDGLPGDLRLVYLPYNQDRSIPTSNIMDAKSGELLDYQGKPLQEGPKPYIFTDLRGVSGSQEIATLGRAGLFGDFGNSFRPQEQMTVASLLRAMYYNKVGLYGNTGLTDEEILTKVKEQGWVKEEVQAGDPVRREFLAKVLLRYMNFTNLAELPDIYRVDFEDAAQISPDALGYVALASGTGIIQVTGEIFAPQDGVSRAEAALAFYRALNWMYKM